MDISALSGWWSTVRGPWMTCRNGWKFCRKYGIFVNCRRIVSEIWSPSETGAPGLLPASACLRNRKSKRKNVNETTLQPLFGDDGSGLLDLVSASDRPDRVFVFPVSGNRRHRFLGRSAPRHLRLWDDAERQLSDQHLCQRARLLECKAAPVLSDSCGRLLPVRIYRCGTSVLFRTLLCPDLCPDRTFCQTLRKRGFFIYHGLSSCQLFSL